MAREIGEEYLSSLVDLDQNSKPMIDMLTMLAGENSQHAAVIVGVIKQRILEVDQNSKLPLLYLIDSIVKNIGGDYKTLLTQAIVGIFCDVFEKVNERVRLKMFGLRQTWNEVFSPTKLMALDVKVNSLDPNWPISRVPKTGVIHVNPNFWNKIPEAAVEPLEQMKAQLEERRRSLLELQKLKLELELQATKKQIEEEQKKINQTAASVGHSIKLDSVLTMNNNVFSGGQPPKAVTNAKVAPVSASLMATIKPRDNRALSASGTSGAPVQDSGKSKGIEKDAYKMSDNSSSRKKSSPSKSGKSSDSSKSSPTKSSGRHSSKDKKKSSSSRSSNSGSEKSPKRGSSSSSSHRKKSGSRSPNTSSGGKHGHSHSRSYSRKSGRREDGSSDKRRRGGGGVADEKEDVILISGSPPRQLSPVKYADKNGPTVNAVMAAVAATTTTSGGLNQKNILEAASTDVDLRQFVPQPPQALLLPPPAAKHMEMDIKDNAIEIMDDGDDLELIASIERARLKKREAAESETSTGEPFTKKSKSEKFDILFGSNDVDLRAMRPVTPPTAAVNHNEREGWAIMKGNVLKKPPTPKTNFEAIRAKIEEASKQKQKRFEDRVIRAQDVDLRSGSGAPMQGEDSQDAIDNKIKIIMTQAQEQLDNQTIDIAQYNNMVKQVIQLNETQKMKEAERREMIASGNRNGDKVEPCFSSESDSDDGGAFRDYRRKQKERKSHFQTRQEQAPSNTQADKAPAPFGGDPRRDPRRKWAGDQQQQRTQASGGQWKQQPQPSAMPFGNQGARHAIQPWQNPIGGTVSALRPNGPRFNTHRMPMNNGVPMPIGLPPAMMNNQQVARKPAEPMLTIKIDNIAREIRFYDDIAVAFMDWDQPKEIGFQMGVRHITCDEQFPLTLSFNAPNITWVIDGVPHEVRLGVPTRELYIDNKWFECYFGDPCRIEIDGKVRTIRITGPPPQVRIGDLRRDLVVGKINMIVDAKVMIPVYLDGREQQFEVDGQGHSLQFADYLMTVLINKEPHAVEFGGLPKSFIVGGVKHFIRFTALPAGVVPGHCYIRGITRSSLPRNVPSPPAPETIQALVGVPPPNIMNQLGLLTSVPPPPARISNGLDMLTNFLPMTAITGNEKTLGYSQESVSQLPEPNATAATNSNPPAVPSVNINDLFQKLLATGILPKTTTDGSSKKESAGAKKQGAEVQPSGTGSSGSNMPVVKEKVVEVNLLVPETIKTRQMAIVQQLYLGMQCSSCGVRFPPEQTMKYSQHLDWHFRQNRRDRDSVRRAHSRKWFYDVNNWIQYEEIEDLEEMEKNWFESQQTDVEMGQDENCHTNGDGQVVPSCPAGASDSERICYVCHEPFDQFYNEETEEWHLRCAMRIEDRTYHPMCYEDYKMSLTLDKSIDASLLKDEGDDVAAEAARLNGEAEDKNNSKDVIKGDGAEEGDDKEVSNAADLSLDNDDDVIVLPNETQTITEILDDDEEEAKAAAERLADQVSINQSEEADAAAALANESDVEIQEQAIPVADVDDLAGSASVVMPRPVIVTIKEEPADDGYEEDAFMDVGQSFGPAELPEEMIIEDDDLSNSKADSITVAEDVSGPIIALDSPASITSVHDPLIAMLDGNVEMAEALPVVPLAGNKIKINISKLATSSLAAANNEGNTDSRDSLGLDENTREDGIIVDGDGALDGVSGASVVEPEPDPVIEFEYKESMKGINFVATEKYSNGVETSGLCSIM